MEPSEEKMPDPAFPIPKTVTLLGEENFLEAMQGAGKKWREKEVCTAAFSSYDGARLRYYYALPGNGAPVILMVHGFCEFWGKYHEMAWYFYQAGYGFFFLEQRGHGNSERFVSRKDLVHVEDYSQYVEDLHQFLEQVVLPAAKDRTLYLFAHSMGGAVGALFLEQYPHYFRKAVFSSPMLDMKTGKIPKPLIRLYSVYLRATKKLKNLSVGQHYFDGIPIFSRSSCLSRVRYDYQFRLRLENENDQTYGGTFGWVLASLAADRRVLRHASRVRTPVLLFTAGIDHLVNPKGALTFASHSADTTIVRYQNSKHEIFNSLEPIRRDYYGRIFSFLGAE